MLSLILVDLVLSLQFDHTNSGKRFDDLFLPEIFSKKLFRETLLVLLLSTYTHALLKDHCSLFMSFGDLSLKATWKLLSWISSFQGFTSFWYFALYSVFLNTLAGKKTRDYKQCYAKLFLPTFLMESVKNGSLKKYTSAFYTGKVHQISVSKLMVENLEELRGVHSTCIHS